MRARDSFSTLTVGRVVATTLVIADADGNEVGLWDGESLTLATTAEVDAALAGKIDTGGAAADIVTADTTITGGNIATGSIQSGNYDGPDGLEDFADVGSAWDLDGSVLITENLRSDSAGLKVRGGGGAGTLELVDGSGVAWGSFDGSTITLGPGGGTSLEVIEGSVILEGSNFATIEAPDVVALTSGNIVLISSGSDYVNVQSAFTLFDGEVRADDVTSDTFLFATAGSIGFYESGTEIRYNSDGAHRWMDNGATKLYLGTDGRLLLYADLRMAGHDIVDAGAITCDAIDTRGSSINMGGGVLTEVNEITADVGSVTDVSYHFDGHPDSGMSGGTDGAVRLSCEGNTVFAAVNNEVYLAPIWDYPITTGSYVRVASSGGRMGRHSSSARYKTDVRPITLEEARRALGIEWVRFRSNLEHENSEHSHYGAIAEDVAEIDPRLAQFDWDEPGPAPKRPEGIDYDIIGGPIHGVLIQDHERRLLQLEEENANLRKEIVEIKKLLLSSGS